MLLPDDVEDAMADVAIVFTGMTLEAMGKMTIPDLMKWRERARVRSQPAEND